jgi:hypothetical protein
VFIHSYFNFNFNFNNEWWWWSSSCFEENPSHQVPQSTPKTLWLVPTSLSLSLSLSHQFPFYSCLILYPSSFPLFHHVVIDYVSNLVNCNCRTIAIYNRILQLASIPITLMTILRIPLFVRLTSHTISTQFLGFMIGSPPHHTANEFTDILDFNRALYNTISITLVDPCRCSKSTQ